MVCSRYRLLFTFSTSSRTACTCSCSGSLSCAKGSSLAAASPLRASKERLVVLQRKGGAVLTILSPPKPAARSRLIIGDFGPSDSALAAASGGRLRRPAADRHAARCASRDLCSGVRPSALYALDGNQPPLAR